MARIKRLALGQDEIDRLNGLIEHGCEVDSSPCDPDAKAFHERVVFADGIEADINVCSNLSDDRKRVEFWAEVALYNDAGQELALSPPSYGGVDGQWTLWLGDDEYVVEVVAADFVWVLEKMTFDPYGYVRSACFAFKSFEAANRSMYEDWTVEWEGAGCAGDNEDGFYNDQVAPFMKDTEAVLKFRNENRLDWKIYRAELEGEPR